MAASSHSVKGNLTNLTEIHNGTTFSEVSLIASYAPISCLLYFVAGLFCISAEIPTWYRFFLENIVLILPGFIAITLLEGHSVLVDLSMLAICLIALLKIKLQFKIKGSHFTMLQSSSGKRQFVLNFRAFTNIGTIISILAVDFSIFPSRLCKSDIYGKGFMDIGVGMFIFGHSIVSHLARGVAKDERNKLKRFTNTVVSCSPIIILGLLRLLSVKASNYHENILEYGVHWNFFFTLAFVKISSEIAIIFLPRIFVDNIVLIGVALAASHQYLLSNGVSEFIQKGSKGDGSRDASFLDANREGIISCIGFIALYFIAIQIGKELFKPISKVQLLKKLLVIDALLWLITFGLETFIEEVSRRMCNGTYISWMLSLSVYLLANFLAVELFQEYILQRLDLKLSNEPHDQKPIVSQREPLSQHMIPPNEAELNKKNMGLLVNPLLVQAVSQNQLMYFLLGNVLTGIINLSIVTEEVRNITSMLILSLYLLAVNLIVVVFHLNNIRTKVW